MEYILSKKYDTPELQALIMGPNPVKLEEELLRGSRIPAGAVVCDLGSGTGLTSVFMAKEYGFTVYAADLWSDPDENRRFFRRMGLSDGQVIPVKADATAMPFEREFFDAVVSTDSYNYFGRDPEYLDAKLVPFVKSGGYIYIALTGMKNDCHDAAALVDSGAAGLHTRRGLLARDSEPEHGDGASGAARDGVERRGVGGLAAAG